MSTTHTTAPLQGGSFVYLGIRIWSGAAVIHRDTDLTAVAGKLPPKTLVVDGNKRLINPKALSPLDALRKQAEAEVKKVGFRFLNGYFVPDQRLPDLETKLQAIEAEFLNVELPEMVSNLQTLYVDWEKEHPAWQSMLRGARLTESEIQSRCSFRTVFYKAAPASDDPTASVNQGLNGMAASIDEALYQDVMSQAAGVVRDTFTNRTAKVSQRTLRPVRALADKLDGFAFLDAGVAKLSAVIETALKSVPSTGFLSQAETDTVVAALNTLGDPTSLAATLAGPAPAATPADPQGDLAVSSAVDTTDKEATEPDDATPEIPDTSSSEGDTESDADSDTDADADADAESDAGTEEEEEEEEYEGSDFAALV